MSSRSVGRVAETADAERKAFWLLKRLTSYSLWRRKRDAWEVFVRAYEYAIKNWTHDELAHVDLRLLPSAYDALARYDDGLANLARGHRFVWRIGQSLCEAHHISGTIFANFYRNPEYWERGMQLNRYPTDIDRLQKLMLDARFHGDQSPLEIPRTAMYRGAYWSSLRGLLNPASYDYGFYCLPHPVFPRELPALPIGGDTIVFTGDDVPVDGIWVPMAACQSVATGFAQTASKESHGSGAYNYFVHGTTAPRIGKYNEATRRVEQVPTLWGLLWADDRYGTGVVGDESEYFLEPERPSKAVAPSDPGDMLTGSVCPASGWWKAVGYAHPEIHAVVGSVMPDLSVRDAKGDMVSHYVRWRLVKRD